MLNVIRVVVSMFIGPIFLLMLIVISTIALIFFVISCLLEGASSVVKKLSEKTILLAEKILDAGMAILKKIVPED